MIVLAGTLKPTLIPWSIENDVPHYYRITSLFEGSYIKTLSRLDDANNGKVYFVIVRGV